MTKRFFVSMLAASLLASMLAGCGKNGNTDTDETNETTQEHVELNVETVDYSGYMTLGEYSGLDIEVDSAEVTQEQIDEAIKNIRENNATYEQITDRTVADNDRIHLQYTGYLDGEAFDNGSTGEEGTDYTIGGNYISDLNDQLIGLECGKEYSLNCRFPDDYPNSDELKGKEVVFVVTVDYIYGDSILPDWNDEFINTYTEGNYTTVEDYEEYMKTTLASNNESVQTQSYQAAVWSTVLDNCEISDYPEDKLDEIYNDFYKYIVQSYQDVATQYSMEYEEILEYYDITDDDIKETCEEQARYQLEYCMASYLIADREGIELTEDEYNEMASSYASYVGYESIAALEEDMTQQYLYDSFMISKVSEYLYDNNNMVVAESAGTTEAE